MWAFSSPSALSHHKCQLVPKEILEERKKISFFPYLISVKRDSLVVFLLIISSEAKKILGWCLDLTPFSENSSYYLSQIETCVHSIRLFLHNLLQFVPEWKYPRCDLSFNLVFTLSYSLTTTWFSLWLLVTLLVPPLPSQPLQGCDCKETPAFSAECVLLGWNFNMCKKPHYLSLRVWKKKPSYFISRWLF